MKNTYTSVQDIDAAANDVMNSAGAIMDDPQNVINGLLAAMGGVVMNELTSRLIAQPITRALVPKYIAGTDDADTVLKKLGVENGMKGLYFEMSSFLKDGRTINIVAVYRVKSPIPLFMEDYLVMKQTASTAAWVKGTKLQDVKPSRWDLSDLDRGKSFAEKLRNQNQGDAVEPGHGIIINVGDTRTYEIFDGHMAQLTVDQTVVAREAMLGVLTPEQARTDPRRNVLLQCIGASNVVIPDFFAGDARQDAVYMLCSDGFRNEVTDAEMFEYFRADLLLDESIMHAHANYLIELNKSRNEQDNITVTLVRTF